MGVVAVQVGKHDDVRAGGVLRRSLTSDSTEMADAGGQDGIEQEGCPVILPRNSAVSPPCHRAAHGVAAPRDPRTAAVPSRGPATIAANRLHVSAMRCPAAAGATIVKVRIRIGRILTVSARSCLLVRA